MASIARSIDFLKDIYEEFELTEAALLKHVNILRQWLEEQPHLPNVEDEDFLALFFLRCKANMERTKEKLEMYYITKARLPAVFRNRDPNSSKYRKFFHLITIVRSRRITENGNGVLTVRIGNVPKDGLSSSTEFLKYVMIQISIHILMAAPCKKFILVVDYRNASMALVTYQLMCLKNFISLSLKVVPGRYEKFYLLHSSSIDVQPLISFARKLSKKLFVDRMVVWNEAAKELNQEIPPECLPTEYGGTEGCFNELAEKCLEEVESFKWWFDEEEKYFADLSKRPPSCKKFGDGIEKFGVDGSFRQIVNVEH